MTERTSKPILVLGATGKTGRRVAHRLAARGIPVRAGSRAAEPPFDWDNHATWSGALRGTRAVYLSYQPDLAVPGAAEVVGAFAHLAAHSGVERLVLLSGRGEAEAEDTERAVLAAGVPTTIVRSSWFAQNFSEGFLLESILDGHVALPVDGIGEPFIDVDDIAEIATAALVEDGHTGQIYDVTGPRLLSFRQAVDEIAHASGRELQFSSITLGEFANELAAAGLPADAVQLVRYLFSEVLDGRNAHLGNGVERALGRAPKRLQCLRDHGCGDRRLEHPMTGQHTTQTTTEAPASLIRARRPGMRVPQRQGLHRSANMLGWRWLVALLAHAAPTRLGPTYARRGSSVASVCSSSAARSWWTSPTTGSGRATHSSRASSRA
jgi:uncharacterized protein YbjT (DUF2867 family)